MEEEDFRLHNQDKWMITKRGELILIGSVIIKDIEEESLTIF